MPPSSPSLSPSSSTPIASPAPRPPPQASSSSLSLIPTSPSCNQTLPFCSTSLTRATTPPPPPPPNKLPRLPYLPKFIQSQSQPTRLLPSPLFPCHPTSSASIMTFLLLFVIFSLAEIHNIACST